MGRFEHGFVVMTLVTIGCARSAPTPSQGVSSSSVAVAPRVDLHPLTLSFRGQPIARLFADGRTESAGPNAPGTVLVPGPTLHADGTMVMTKGGVTARLDDRGDIYVVGPAGASPREQLFGRIVGDELAFAGSDRPWSVRVRGNLIEFGPDNSSQIDGDVTPSMRHTALVMAAAFYIDGAIGAPQGAHRPTGSTPD
ncbi:MAG: hypothetical protein IT373_12175 [Polyangiaceae bacterium]|nr:hypothetical protein [Polyangiaceae bacterium]